MIGILGFAIFIAIISFIINAFNTFTHLPITTFFTGFLTLPVAVGFVFALVQTLFIVLQLCKGLVLDPLLNSNIRNVVSCDIFNYKTPIVLIFIMFSLLNAVMYLSTENLATYVLTVVFFFILYIFLFTCK